MLAAVAMIGAEAVVLAGCTQSGQPARPVWQVRHIFGPAAGQTDIYSMSALSIADV